MKRRKNFKEERADQESFKRLGRLRIAEKFIDGIPVGFHVGHRVHNRWHGDRFKRIRGATTFKTLEDARAYRDYIESQRSDSTESVKFSIIED